MKFEFLTLVTMQITISLKRDSTELGKQAPIFWRNLLPASSAQKNTPCRKDSQ